MLVNRKLPIKLLTVGLASVAVAAGAFLLSGYSGDSSDHTSDNSGSVRDSGDIREDTERLERRENRKEDKWAFVVWLQGWEQGQVAIYAANIHQAYLDYQAYLASLPKPASTYSGSTVTGECGGATNGADQFIGRESGGDPNVYNTGGSGAWGCYQIMPGTWAGSCSDIGSHGSATPAQQAECASRLPLSAWGG